MDNIVFDASVIIAMLRGEQIEVVDLPMLRTVSMSAVNVAEVCTLLEDEEEPASRAGFQLLSLLRTIEPFTESQARRAGELRRLGKNISLGDRACLSLAVDLNATVYTADRAWKTFDVGYQIYLIR